MMKAPIALMAAFAAVLYKVVTGGAVVGALTDLVQQALSVKF